MSTIVGVIFILAGIGWFLFASFAAGMASREITWWESTGAPMLGVIPVLIGILLMIWG